MNSIKINVIYLESLSPIKPPYHTFGSQ